MSLLRAKALLTKCTILVAASLQTCCGHSTSYWFPNFLKYSEKCKFIQADTTRILIQTLIRCCFTINVWVVLVFNSIYGYLLHADPQRISCFLAGFQKCGTTYLAACMTINGATRSIVGKECMHFPFYAITRNPLLRRLPHWAWFRPNQVPSGRWR